MPNDNSFFFYCVVSKLFQIKTMILNKTQHHRSKHTQFNWIEIIVCQLTWFLNSNQAIFIRVVIFKKITQSIEGHSCHVDFLLEKSCVINIGLIKISSIFHPSNTKTCLIFQQISSAVQNKQTNCNENYVFIHVYASVLKCKYLCHRHEWYDWVIWESVDRLILFVETLDAINIHKQTKNWWELFITSKIRNQN